MVDEQEPVKHRGEGEFIMNDDGSPQSIPSVGISDWNTPRHREQYGNLGPFAEAQAWGAISRATSGSWQRKFVGGLLLAAMVFPVVVAIYMAARFA